MARRGWTVNTLREHIDVRLTELDLRNQQRFDAAEKASAIAFAEAQRWREAANEWRGAMSDRERMMLPRTEYDAAHQALIEKIDAVSARVDRAEGSRTGGRELWGYLVGAVGVVAAIVALILR